MRASVCLLVTLLINVAYAAEEPPVYRIDFDGGSALEFWDLIDALEINVIMPADAAEITLPPIRLRNVSAEDLFRALSIIGRESPIQFQWSTSGRDMPTLIGRNGSIIGDRSNQIWVLRSTGSQNTAQPFAIGHLLASDANEDGYTVDEITSAIDSTVEAAAAATGRTSAIEFKYHEGTELLIITGKVKDVRVAASTLATLRNSVQTKTWGVNFGGYDGWEGFGEKSIYDAAIQSFGGGLIGQ